MVATMIFSRHLSKEEAERESRRERARLKTRSKLGIPPEPPRLEIRGIPVRSCRINIGFWNGFRLSESLAAVKVILEDEGPESISVCSYMKYARINIQQMIKLVSGALPALTFYHSYKDESAVHFKLSSIRSSELRGLLKERRGSLRGMRDRSAILCESGNFYVSADEVVGYIPSVPTSHVTYPNATYRDTDWGDVMSNPGEPVVVHGSTNETPGYPIEFTVHKTPKRDRSWLDKHTLLWAVEFETVKGEV